MPVVLEAPFPALQTTTILPSPEFSDSEGMTSELRRHRAMTGKLYTYVKTTADRRKLLMQFRLDELKSYELQAFIRSYFASKIRITDINANIWIANFTSNPFDMDQPDQRAAIQLEFEGFQQ